MQGRKVRKWILRPLFVVAGIVGLLIGYRLLTDNFGIVELGRVYRSAQMGPTYLARTVRGHGIKTVLNLRGDNPSQAWYRFERAATVGAGATQVDVHMASNMWLSRSQFRNLIRIVDACETPLLIHCEWGAERTGLTSAVVTLLRPGSTLAEAKRQFSIKYMFLRIGDGAVMAEHLDLYEQWLRSTGLPHSPARFRHWVAKVYQPAGPSREQWPYDPYPPLVVSHRAGQRDRLDDLSAQLRK